MQSTRAATTTGPTNNSCSTQSTGPYAITKTATGGDKQVNLHGRAVVGRGAMWSE